MLAGVASVGLWTAPALANAELPCVTDEALQETAASILLANQPIEPEDLVELAREAGSDLTAIRGLRLVANDRVVISEWLRRTEEELDADVICGVAEGRDAVLILAGARAGALLIEAGPPIQVRAQLDDEFSDPRLVLRDGEGALRRVPLTREALMAGVTLEDGLVSPVRVQLVASGPRGPRPIAERIVRFASEQRDIRPPAAGAEDAEPTGPEWIAEARRVRGALPLRPNRLLSVEALAHARAVCDSGRVGHELEPGNDPELRLRRRGIVARVVGEVVARAVDDQAARRALLDSPSHHMTLVDRRFTDGGHGVAHDDDGHVCTVVLLAAWPRFVPR